jgi:hypothetical protein
VVFLNGSKSRATAKLVYVINQWPNPFGPISNPPAFGVIYVIKYSGGFRYFISHDIKIGLKSGNTMGVSGLQSVGWGVSCEVALSEGPKWVERVA